MPGNIATLVNKFQADGEAPSLTWVFELPTGREEVYLTLADYWQVAEVLKVMLDVLLLIGVVGLLVKIAELFNLVNGE